MSNIAIQFDNIGKLYHLGAVGTGTLSHDLNRWWKTVVLKQEDPYLKVGETNERSKRGHSEFVWALKTYHLMSSKEMSLVLSVKTVQESPLC